MLTVSPEYFSTDDIAEIKNWLSLKGGGLFRKAIENEIAQLQIEASNEMIKGMEPGKPRFKDDAESKLRRVRELQVILDYVKLAASGEFKPFVAKVVTV